MLSSSDNIKRSLSNLVSESVVCTIHYLSSAWAPWRSLTWYQKVCAGNVVDRRAYHETNMFMDNGPTNHLTSDLEHLTTQEYYSDKDKVQVANSASLSISHTEISCLASSHKALLLKKNFCVPSISKHLHLVSRLVLNNHSFIEFHTEYFTCALNA